MFSGLATKPSNSLQELDILFTVYDLSINEAPFVGPLDYLFGDFLAKESIKLAE
jgi:hypothetical protein